MDKINQLAKRQESCGDLIATMLKNLKEEAASSKQLSSQDYKENLKELVQSMDEATRTHHALEKLGEQENLKGKHDYFTSNYYSQIQDVYDTTRSFIEKRCRDTESIELQQEHRLKEQKIRINELEEMLSEAEDIIPQNKPKTRYDRYIQEINRQWEIIGNINIEIKINEVKFVDKYFTESKLKNTREKYCEIIEKLEEKIALMTNRTVINSNETNACAGNIKLPPVKIPYFDGTYENWITFRDMFSKLVHDNTSLSNIEKMQFLKTQVRGEAMKSIQHFQISEANYESAWTQLQDRYGNKRLIASKLINKILDLPVLHTESAEDLKTLYYTTTECLEALKMMEIDTSSWGPMIICIISKKWDPKTNELYETTLTHPMKVQPMAEFQGFLLRRLQALEATAESRRIKGFVAKQAPQVQQSNSPKTVCKLCNLSHQLYQCPEFKKKSTYERFSFAREKGICYNCLNHKSSEKCNSQSTCRICQQNHHTLLHRDSNNSSKTSNNKAPLPQSNQKIASHLVQKPIENVVLATALIKVRTNAGQFEYLRALIDSGSQAAFITEEAAALLNLPREKICAEFSGLGAGKITNCKQKIQAICTPRFSSSYRLNTDLFILPVLTNKLPEQELSVNLDVWQNKLLADPTFFKTGPIDVILGAREYHEFLQEGIQKTDIGLLGQNTEFGWIIYGSSPVKSPETITIVSMIAQTVQEQELSRFWEVEDAPASRDPTPEENACEEIFQSSTIRNEDGKYTVTIPFKNKNTQLGESRSRALARLHQLEKRLAKHAELDIGYKQFMNEYIELGHMEIVPRSDQYNGKYYIPHQAVLRESSTTTKLRVVFDASCKTTTNMSLNEMMHIGTRLQQDLSDIILRWRQYPIVFTADIEKMYRQIWIQKPDQDYQRILWRFNAQDPIQEYKLCTVTYGTASAPYLAIRTIQQLARDEMNNYPRAASVALRDFYVDDLLSGTFTLEDAVTIRDELISMFNSGGFTIRKWSSNSQCFLNSIQDQLKDKSNLDLSEEKSDIKKPLGIHWAPNDDTIRFNVNISRAKIVTKRHIISEAARLFDPLGWLSPVVVIAKILIQELWMKSLGWDEKVPDDIQQRWDSFQIKLEQLSRIKISRWTHQEKRSHFDLHGFCDASEKAYGAVIYLKTKDESQPPQITLLISKSKVAPLKTKLTLPKLELCAAVLLAKLLKRVLTALDEQKVSKVYGWTDSMITLCWIRGDPNKWKTFVANRVSTIHASVPATSWLHVRSEENPADAISRGIDPSKIEQHQLWWKGPDWLKNNTHETSVEIPESTEEMRKNKYHVNVNTTTSHKEELFGRFSSLTKMNRVIAYCNRFISKCRKIHPLSLHLTTTELTVAEKQIIRMEQKSSFHQEINELIKGNQIKKNSKLLPLNPFLDSDGILRVGGRLHHALLSYSEKHPMILCGQSHIGSLIIQHAHAVTLHGGNQLTLAQIRKKYWITNGKKAVKKILNKCVKCIRYKAETAKQLMGQLPVARVTPAPAFAHVGVDYAGPIMIRTTKGRGHKSYKGYIAIFVCLATKAIHLEVVSDMLAETFVAALKRFMSRRGPCANIYSDNGTTFIGANSVIEKEVEKMIRNSDIIDKSASWGIQWHFIPPASPHFGGLWEAGVKSTKHHLRRIIGETTLTFEELSTLLCQVEATLNSRPLCTLTEEINDINILTPGHFIIGRDVVSTTNPVVDDGIMDLTGRWKILQKMKKEFWKVWSTDYLHQQQQRYKWNTLTQNLRADDVVLIKDDNMKWGKWPLARIIDTHPDAEGNVRVVTLQKSDRTVLKRPVHKLIYLPTSKEQDENKRRPRQDTSPKTRWKIAILAILFLNFLSSCAASTYVVEYPAPGLFVEHIGEARVDRGTFRIEIKFNKSALNEEAKSISDIVKQMEKLCDNTKYLSSNIECASLVHQLRDREKQMNWITTGIQTTTQRRDKRGILGNLMTSLFGVNDEVYQDIDSLEKNQQELLHLSNHQNKIMVQALSKFNETETRIYEQMNHFRKKLNDGLNSINEMEKWYKKIDENKLSIHLLSTYQLAVSYLDEMLLHYTKILEAHYDARNLYQFISPAHIEEILSSSSTKLPSSLTILPHPILRTEVEHSAEFIHLYGYFAITEKTSYMMIKVTPIPLKVESSVYWIFDVIDTIIAIDYNTQKYFELSELEFKTSIDVGKHSYVCSPAIIKDIESNPNCVIDEIYGRTDNITCKISKYRVKSLLWKSLYTTNSWMFISPETTKIAVTCNGNREDVKLNKTGIITISQNCIIIAEKMILTPKRNVEIPVIAAFARPLAVNLTTSTIHTARHIAPEGNLVSSNNLNSIAEEEMGIHDEIQEKHWKTVHHQSILTSSLTAIILTIALVVIVYGIRITIATLKKRRGPKEEISREESKDEEGIELTPLRNLLIEN